MKTLEDWILYILGGFVAVGAAVTGRVIHIQDEHAERLAQHDASIASLAANATNTKESLERIESKLDRAIEREHGA
jgi:outer membrane lipoprotein-sorting protein